MDDLRGGKEVFRENRTLLLQKRQQTRLFEKQVRPGHRHADREPAIRHPHGKKNRRIAVGSFPQHRKGENEHRPDLLRFRNRRRKHLHKGPAYWWKTT